MAFPVTGTLDNFNRADGALGSNWTGGFFGDAINLTIVSNAAISAGAGFGGSSWNGALGPDFEIWCVLARGFTAGATEEVWLEPLDSQTNGSPSGFGLVAGGTGGSNKGLTLYRFDAGSISGALLNDNTITWAAGDGFGFTRTGSTLQVYHLVSGGSWTQVGGNVTDSHYLTSLFLGCECASNTSNQATVDTFGGGTLGSTVYTKTGAGVAKLYGTGRRGGTLKKTGAGVAKLYGTGARGGVIKKSGAGAAKAYATGGKQYITPSNFLTTTMPVVPFREQASPGVYIKTGSGIGSLSATGAKQYFLGGTGTLYQKTGAGALQSLIAGGGNIEIYGKRGYAIGNLSATGARAGGTIPPPPTPPLHVLRDAILTVAGVDLSDHVDSLEILIHQDMIDITKYGDTAPHYTLGLRTDRISATFIQDFSTNKVHQVISALLGSSGFVVTCKPRSGVTAVTNPLYTATCILASYTPLAGKVGDRADAPVVFQPIAQITQATS